MSVILIVLGNCVQHGVALRLDVDRQHPLNRVLEPHLVVDHVGLDAEGHHVRLETCLGENVFVLGLLFVQTHDKYDRD